MVRASGSTERNCTMKEKTSAFKEVFQSSAIVIVTYLQNLKGAILHLTRPPPF